MKLIATTLYLLLFSLSSYAQKMEPLSAVFGEITQEDISYISYELDPEVPAVVLYEKGINTFENINNYIRLVKTIHRKIKVLDASRFDGASIGITYYQGGKFKERVKDLKAVTHNGIVKSYVKSDAIFEVDLSEDYGEKRFTFPDVKNGSIIEFRYRLETPYFFNFNDWEYQGELPKLYSEFSADIPANYKYKRSLVGYQPLDVKISVLKKNCFELEGFKNAADCDSFTYAMYNVPAYREEPFMLSKRNYISRLSFEFQESTSLTGKRSLYSKTWKDVEREFKYEKNIGRQLKATSFFEDKLPVEVLETANLEERARKVYHFIQDHYSWNGEYRIFSEIRVKNAFEEKIGNISEINLSLINALNAAGLDAKLSLSTTRDVGLVSDLFPVLTDFNYVMAYLKIGDKEYLLDATDKFLAFGMTPFKTLNGRTRIMDFDEGSYWHTIIPELKNLDYYKFNLTLSDKLINGDVQEVHAGYKAYKWRKKIAKEGTKILYRDLDNQLSSITFNNERDINEKPLKVSQKLVLDVHEQGEDIYFNPLAFNFEMLENPFPIQERKYPINLGYPSSTIYDLTLEIPEGYTITNLPEDKMFKLGEDMGSCSVMYRQNNNQLQCVLRFRLSSYTFDSSLYSDLQSFFTGVTNEHKNATVKIKRN